MKSFVNLPMDLGIMYQRTFQVLDRHQWEMIGMDPNAAPPQA